MLNSDLIDIPKDYCCPITQDLMNEPVVVADGHTYEKAAIIRWMETGHRTSPLTGARLSHFNLTDNFALKKVIDEFRERFPQIQHERQIKVDLDKAVKLREEMVAHYLEKKDQENLGYMNELANEKIKNQRLEEELEQARPETTQLKEQVTTMSNQMQEMQKMMLLNAQQNNPGAMLNQYQLPQPIKEEENKQKQIQPRVSVNPQELQKFLNLVARGAQVPAENMLRENRDLALAKGVIVDHAERKFEDITGFQYAVWALDWEMWEMIMEYMPVDAQIEQAAGLDKGSWVVEHKEHVDWQGLIDALQMYINNFFQWDCDKRDKYWIQQCGGAQLRLPYHVFQEYDHPTRSFDPTPDFTKKQLSGNTREADDNFNSFNIGDVGEKYTIIRGKNERMFKVLRTMGVVMVWKQASTAHLKSDCTSLASLMAARSQQRENLLTELLTLKNTKEPKP